MGVSANKCMLWSVSRMYITFWKYLFPIESDLRLFKTDRVEIFECSVKDLVAPVEVESIILTVLLVFKWTCSSIATDWYIFTDYLTLSPSMSYGVLLRDINIWGSFIFGKSLRFCKILIFVNEFYFHAC